MPRSLDRTKSGSGEWLPPDDVFASQLCSSRGRSLSWRTRASLPAQQLRALSCHSRDLARRGRSREHGRRTHLCDSGGPQTRPAIQCITGGSEPVKIAFRKDLITPPGVAGGRVQVFGGSLWQLTDAYSRSFHVGQFLVLKEANRVKIDEKRVDVARQDTWIPSIGDGLHS